MRTKQNINHFKKKKIPNKYRMDQIIYNALERSEKLKENINNLYSRLNTKGEVVLKICTINTHGYNNNKICNNDLIGIHDIVIVQEHMCPNEKTLRKNTS